MDGLREIFRELEAACSTASTSFKKSDVLGQIDKLCEISKNQNISELENLGKALKNYIQELPWEDTSSSETKQLLQFAFATFRERLEANGWCPTSDHISEFCELTGLRLDNESPEEENTGESAVAEEISKIESILGETPETRPLDLENLKNLVGRIGGEVVSTNGDDGFLAIRFPAQHSTVSYLERVFALSDPDEELLGKEIYGDPKLLWLVGKIKEFMFAFSQGNVNGARKILEELAEPKDAKGGLYDEIGKLARQLHEALKNISKSLDPKLREFAEEKLPDSGDRLEHILKLTEHAANTTLDHVEILQTRKAEEENIVSRIRTVIGLLHPLGDNAKSKVDEIMSLTESLISHLQSDEKDLVTIMTAQDFQDLTGQIIIKIIRLMKELETSLINLITSFGIPVSGKKGEKPAPKEFLYGPAHDKREDALKSQEDVDALLAEFGF